MNEQKWFVVSGEPTNKEGAERRARLMLNFAEWHEFRAVQLVDAAELEQAQKRIAELEMKLDNMFERHCR